MSKYEPLRAYLNRGTAARIVMTFDEIEHVIGSRLPESALLHEAWWANEKNGSHVQARAWLEAGYRTAEIDKSGRKLTFRRIRRPDPAASDDFPGMAEEGRAFVHAAERDDHPMFGALKGLLRIAPDCDLTRPALPDREKRFEEKWGEKLG
jgi:hypothetical protein